VSSDCRARNRFGEDSFYNTLKSKKHAYLEFEVLQCDRRTPASRGIPLGTNGQLGVRALFQSVLDCLDDPKAPSHLCLMAASITHEVLAESDLR
jgi:TetR/AcrR family transcriptional regulator, transcriptional repressor for nem operon